MSAVVRVEPHEQVAAGKCGAKTRKSAKHRTCQQTAGARTPHSGVGKCWLHGGLTPIKSGRYSKITRERIRDLIEHHENDSDPLNILPELAAARALFQDFIERYDEHTQALVAWHTSFQLTRKPLPEDLLLSLERVVEEYELAVAEAQGRAIADDAELTEKQMSDVAAARKFLTVLRGNDAEGLKPRTVLDISDAYRIVTEVTKIVERIDKMRNANAISRPDLQRLIFEMRRVVEVNVLDPTVREQIRQGWLEIRFG